jgi:hypothetical protein
MKTHRKTLMECEHDTHSEVFILIRFNLLIIASIKLQLFPGFGLKSILGILRGGSIKSRAGSLIIYILKLFLQLSGRWNNSNTSQFTIKLQFPFSQITLCSIQRSIASMCAVVVQIIKELRRTVKQTSREILFLQC